MVALGYKRVGITASCMVSYNYASNIKVICMIVV